jgi:hypothetical protein
LSKGNLVVATHVYIRKREGKLFIHIQGAGVIQQKVMSRPAYAARLSQSLREQAFIGSLTLGAWHACWTWVSLGCLNASGQFASGPAPKLKFIALKFKGESTYTMRHCYSHW